MQKGKKCFIWNASLSSMYEEHPSKIGGFSVQLLFWAQAFHHAGYEVHSLSLSTELIDKEVPVIFHVELVTRSSYFSHAKKILKEVHPDIVITRGGKNRNLFYVALLCRLMHIPLVQFQGSDLDLLPLDNSFGARVNSWMYKKGLRLTKFIVAQNAFQEEDFHRHISKRPVLQIPNVWSSDLPFKEVNVPYDNYLLWVGNFREVKNPMLLLDIAEKLPQYTFLVVGAPMDSSLYKEVEHRVKSELNNVKLLGSIPFFEMNNYYAKARAIVCTSVREGFPNTFLQAWSLDKPVVSSVDPSDLIERFRLGYHCSDVDQFVEKITEIYTNDIIYDRLKNNVSEYFVNAHEVKTHFDRLQMYMNS
jgi:glycosyltransferase involved in cell wall biosynthesis